MCNNTQKKKAAGAGKDFTLFFGVILHFNFKCALNYDTELRARKLTQIIKANLEEVCANSIKRQNFYYPIKNPSIHAQLQRYEATQL